MTLLGTADRLESTGCGGFRAAAPGNRGAHPNALRDWLETSVARGSRPGSVLAHAPSHVFQSPGGGEYQLIQTSVHLEAIGCEVRPFVGWVDRIEDARLLHLYGMSREGLGPARVARSRGVPVVLSPICWYEPRALVALADGPRSAACALAGWTLRTIAPRTPSWRRELLALADLVLPNSRAEARQLTRLFGVDPARIRVTPNGVEPRFATATPDLWHARFGDEPFVLFVGRIEPRKNLLNLIRAMRGLGVPLVAIGDAPAGFEGYDAECRRAGAGFVRRLPAFDHADPLLESAYAAARVFALPSWFETPGLAALEAAAAGAAVVITPFGCTHEYFHDDVEYARPDRAFEIARAIESAWRRVDDGALGERVARCFTWSVAARITAEAYDEVAG